MDTPKSETLGTLPITKESLLAHAEWCSARTDDISGYTAEDAAFILRGIAERMEEEDAYRALLGKLGKASYEAQMKHFRSLEENANLEHIDLSWEKRPSQYRETDITGARAVLEELQPIVEWLIAKAVWEATRGDSEPEVWPRPEPIPEGVVVEDSFGRECVREKGLMVRLSDGSWCGGLDGPFVFVRTRGTRDKVEKLVRSWDRIEDIGEGRHFRPKSMPGVVLSKSGRTGFYVLSDRGGELPPSPRTMNNLAPFVEVTS